MYTMYDSADIEVANSVKALRRAFKLEKKKVIFISAEAS